MYWYNGKCLKPADMCPYAHEYTGYTIRDAKVVPIEPSDKSNQPNEKAKKPNGKAKKSNEKAKPSTLTCWFWKNTECRNTAETCLYCHYDTGTMATNPRPPRNAVSVNEIEIQPRSTASASLNKSDKLSDRAAARPKTLPDQHEEIPAAPRNHGPVVDQPADDAVLTPDVEMSGTDQPEPSAEPTNDFDQQSKTPSALQQPPLVEPPRNLTTCLALKQAIEQACRLDFTDMFSINIKRNETTTVKRAFLIFHPEAHATELDLITRWLLMHHIEVSNPWFDGAWNYFREETIKGGSGVVIVSEDLGLHISMLMSTGTTRL
jgi:chromo domain-containing protein 1